MTSFAEAVTAVVDDVPAGVVGSQRHAGSMLSSDDRRRLLTRRGLSRRFIISAALLSIASVLAGFAALPTLQARLEPPTIEYAVLPVPLVSAAPQTPGRPVPLLLSRCINDPSLNGRRGAYDLSRALVAADESTAAALAAAFPYEIEPGPPARLILPPTFTDAGNGCEQSVSTRNVLPLATPAGSYFLEGVARYIGPSGRLGSAYWRSDQFTVTGGTTP